MALPLAGIAANLLLGAAVGVGVSLFGGRDTKSASPTPKASTPVRQGNTSMPWLASRPVDTSSAVSQAAAPQTISITQAVRPSSPQATARPQTRGEQAGSLASDIQRLPVFTPTAPTLSTKSYTSQRREDVQKTKAGEQQLRNPLAIDPAATSDQIKSNLPSIGVSASGTGVSATSAVAKPMPITKRGNNAR